MAVERGRSQELVGSMVGATSSHVLGSLLSSWKSDRTSMTLLPTQQKKELKSAERERHTVTSPKTFWSRWYIFLIKLDLLNSSKNISSLDTNMWFTRVTICPAFYDCFSRTFSVYVVLLSVLGSWEHEL